MRSPWLCLRTALHVGAMLATLLGAAAPMRAQPVAPTAEAAAATTALVARGEALRQQGLVRDALAVLRRAAEVAPDTAARAFADAALGVALRQAGLDAEAEARLSAAADATDTPAVAAVATAELAALVRERTPVETRAQRAARLGQADALIGKAVDLAERAAAPGVTAHVSAVQARIDAAAGRDDQAAAALRRGLGAAAAFDASRDATDARLLLGLGDAALQLAAASPDAALLARRAYGGAAAGGGRVGGLAALGLGETALAAGDPAAAQAQAAIAARAASALGDETLGFSADWLTAEALAAANRPDAALRAYRAAFDRLRRFRDLSPMGAPPTAAVRRGADDRFQRAYIAFLLARDDASLFAEARAAAEDLKLDEVDEYFQERCAPARDALAPVETLSGGVAAIYPILFEDRLEILYAIGPTVGRRTAPIGAEALRREVSRLRYLIDAPTRSADAPARALYRALIGPIERDLVNAAVDTLVIAPDGPLRAVPFAALDDGRGPLIDRYAVATVLGLGLVRRESFQPATARALAAGASSVPGGYPRLPSVPREIGALRATFPGGALTEEAFRVDALAAAIAREPFDIIHIASHAEFGASPDENFIVATDGRLDVTRLESIMRARAVRSGQPVSVFALSACNTAAGLDDDAGRGALGLASVGFRSGARSVLASLWPADDAAAAELMARFYAGLARGEGRAEALRRAQLALRADPRFSDPFQWANFVLIGDWR